MTFFILLHHILWPSTGRSSSLALHLGLAILGAAVWTLSFALRIPLYLLSSLLCHTMRTLTPYVSASLQVFVEESLRLSSLILVHLHYREKSTLSPYDPTFSYVWTVALGWAAVEVAVSVYQGYCQLLLYKDTITSDDSTWPHLPRLPGATEGPLFHNFEDSLSEEIDRVIRSRERAELEALYGIPVPVRRKPYMIKHIALADITTPGDSCICFMSPSH